MEKGIERDTVRSFIMHELMTGTIKVGQKLSLPYFAEKLACSVTPIREALTQLEYAGVVTAIPNRGFLIPELNIHEAKNIYELIACLENLALENSVFKDEDIKQLKKANKKFMQAKDFSEKIKADFELHDCLTKNYENPFAHQKLRDLKIRIFTYERSFTQC
jgi:DNA-binding GntR family transcriptional regulator